MSLAQVKSFKYGDYEVCRSDLVQANAEKDGLDNEQTTGSFKSIEIDTHLRCGLDQPVDFPPIRRAIIPGDTIAIAVGRGIPSTAHVVNELIAAVADIGVIPQDDIVVVLPDDTSISTSAFGEVKTVIHDAQNRSGLAYLKASPAAEPIYINRCLFDADVVIPIISGDGATQSDVCPSFCDKQTIDRFNTLSQPEVRPFMDDVCDWLGVFWTIAVVAGPSQSIQHIFVGDRRKVARLASEAGKRIWNVSVEPAELIIATLESSDDQTWESALRSIVAADRACVDDGAIVLGTRISKTMPTDWLDGSGHRFAETLHDILQRRHVYLISNLPAEVAENCGFASIQSNEQLNRFVAKFRSVLVLRDAHKLNVHVISTSATAL